MYKIASVLGFLGCSLTMAGIPRIPFSYAKIFDSICTQKTGYKIQASWVTELNSRLQDLQASWDKAGSKLLRASADIVGEEFQELEIGASLSLCDAFPSLHDPLLINIRYSLKSFTESPLTTDVTISIVFHEILHRYLNGKIPNDSQLLLKYKAEDEAVLSHLHLFALQKAVYLKLGQESILRDVIKKDESLPNPAYKRTWEIVNSLEDYNAFVKELMSSKGGARIGSYLFGGQRPALFSEYLEQTR